MSVWNERYAGEAFAFGTEPNVWLESVADRLKPRSRILALGEGEGRNAVWLAQQGHRVEAVDASSVGLAKARRLAEERGVTLTTTVADLAEYRPEVAAYDAAILVFLHLPPALRAAVHGLAEAALVPGGFVILQAFTPRQLAFTSGGPRQAEMLYDAETLRGDFPGVTWEALREEELELDEGPNHLGRAAVVSGLGRRIA